ncbi:MAG: tripartite tricarboxylate transporter TctB family protein [Hyphomicrobiaceae bacterium]|nr:tripartite tricarboxylate transporter TctB family protein [Hyphomicrobiaceae bacterium]
MNDAFGADTEPARVAPWLNKDVLAGVLLIVVAAVGLFGARDLGGGGSALMPRATAMLLAAFGAVVLVQGFRTRSAERVETVSWRALTFILAAILVFAVSIRPVGLAFAGFAAVTIASLADPSVRLRLAIPYAIALTVASVLLFRVVLRQPIPLAPMLVGY